MGTLLIGAVFVGVVLLAVWGLRRVVREAAPALAEVPGGGWTVGAVLGLLSLAGWAGGNRLTGRGQGVCWSVAVGVPIAVILALPGRNCRSDAGTCAYIPGTGGVAVAYGVTVAMAGGLWYLGRRSRAGRR
ncbi:MULTISPECIES: hypothetical protein [Streptomyces]|uniref:Integral membrane protein n=2 Tax=Streptomyces TaxID=1883 RepID=A0ABV9IYB8_9ACTN